MWHNVDILLVATPDADLGGKASFCPASASSLPTQACFLLVLCTALWFYTQASSW